MLLKTIQGWQVWGLSLPQHNASGSNLGRKVAAGKKKKKDPFWQNQSISVKLSEQHQQVKWVQKLTLRNIPINRWIFLYRSNFCFLPVLFLTPRMMPAALHSTAALSLLKESFFQVPNPIRTMQVAQLMTGNQIQCAARSKMHRRLQESAPPANGPPGLPTPPGFLRHPSQLQ